MISGVAMAGLLMKMFPYLLVYEVTKGTVEIAVTYAKKKILQA